jgi:hypothetical protein
MASVSPPVAQQPDALNCFIQSTIALAFQLRAMDGCVCNAMQAHECTSTPCIKVQAVAITIIIIITRHAQLMPRCCSVIKHVKSLNLNLFCPAFPVLCGVKPHCAWQSLYQLTFLF